MGLLLDLSSSKSPGRRGSSIPLCKRYGKTEKRSRFGTSLSRKRLPAEVYHSPSLWREWNHHRSHRDLESARTHRNGGRECSARSNRADQLPSLTSIVQLIFVSYCFSNPLISLCVSLLYSKSFDDTLRHGANFPCLIQSCATLLALLLPFQQSPAPPNQTTKESN